MFSSAKMAKSQCHLIIHCCTSSSGLIRNQFVSALFGGRVIIDAAKRLLFSYRGGYAEVRIYTRQFGWKCEFVCKNLTKEN